MSKESRKARSKNLPGKPGPAAAPVTRTEPLVRPASNQSRPTSSLYDAQQYIRKDLAYSGLAAGVVFLVLVVFYLVLH
jgi:hypothetical protein